jgi:hypothetical protein
VSVLIVIAAAAVGYRLVRDGRQARKTGVARIIFQWPGDFDRETHPTQFRFCVSLATVVGCALLIGAVLGMLGFCLQLIHKS